MGYSPLSAGGDIGEIHVVGADAAQTCQNLGERRNNKILGVPGRSKQSESLALRRRRRGGGGRAKIKSGSLLSFVCGGLPVLGGTLASPGSPRLALLPVLVEQGREEVQLLHGGARGLLLGWLGWRVRGDNRGMTVGLWYEGLFKKMSRGTHSAGGKEGKVA